MWKEFLGERDVSHMLSIDISKAKPPVKTCEGDLSLCKTFFAAPVTLSKPAKSTFVLTSLFEGQIDFYLNGALVSTPSSDTFVPAWGVSICDKECDANCAVELIHYQADDPQWPQSRPDLSRQASGQG